MKILKASKGLIKAIACLVASVVLCAGACLAWFTTNGKVDANDLNSNIKSTNITKFEIEAFELTNRETDTTGGQTVTKYKVGDKKGATTVQGVYSVKMSDYGGLVGGSVTALLLKFTYEFEEDLNKNYAIYANCTKTRSAVQKGDTVGGVMHLKCALSSVISIYDIGETEAGTSSTVTQTDEKQGEEIADSDGSIITLKDGISDSALSGTFYCIIDYVENKVFTQYYKALTIEGTTLSTPMDFSSDIEFYIGESSSS